MTDSTNTDAWVSLKALSNANGRSFAEALERFTRYAFGAELGVRSSVAADIRREWLAEDATRTENERRAAERAAEKRDQERSIKEGMALLEHLDATRVDQSMTEEAMSWECDAERLPLLERRLEADLAAVEAAVQAWVDWKRRNAAAAVAVEALRHAGASPQADPGGFAPQAPDWAAEDREFKRQQALEAERQREALRASLRAELAGGAS